MLVARPLRHLAFLSVVSISLFACGGDDGAGTGDSATDTGSDEQTPESGETGEEDDPNLLAIPGGTFEMGCGPSDVPCDADNPPHEVTISAFEMEATEVTVAAYTECVDAGACSEASGPDCNYGVITMAEHPINCVTWQQAADYCAWKGRRLPTEAEWEYAATGGADRPYPWGSAAASCERAHMFQQIEQMGDYGCMTGTTAAVGSYPNGASPFGMLDMAGNVEEWVADWYAEDYYASSPASDPQGPSDGTQRVHRGGDLYDASPLNLRVFERWHSDPTLAATERGFRCAR
jgi:iron(II)-dependent oxidoreductase